MRIAPPSRWVFRRMLCNFWLVHRVLRESQAQVIDWLPLPRRTSDFGNNDEGFALGSFHLARERNTLNPVDLSEDSFSQSIRVEHTPVEIFHKHYNRHRSTTQKLLLFRPSDTKNFTFLCTSLSQASCPSQSRLIPGHFGTVAIATRVQ